MGAHPGAAFGRGGGVDDQAGAAPRQAGKAHGKTGVGQGADMGLREGPIQSTVQSFAASVKAGKGPIGMAQGGPRHSVAFHPRRRWLFLVASDR